MRITLLQVGKTNDKKLNELIKKYESRINHYIRFEIVDIPDTKFSKKLNLENIKAREGELIEKRILPGSFVILLDERGKQHSSKKFADYIQHKMNLSVKQLVFIIGGAYGFSDKVYEIANDKIALSEMTFSHQIVRLLFMEQLYRAFSIIKGEPYHHE
ncbi:23S rRNA (pseudouridine(1915)-N(3))-methyltransferase RlmH [Bacteroidota bacterium]